MHDALGDALVIEVRDLLAQHEIFEQCGSARARPQRVLIVSDGDSLIRRQRLLFVAGRLVRLSAGTATLLDDTAVLAAVSSAVLAAIRALLASILRGGLRSRGSRRWGHVNLRAQTRGVLCTADATTSPSLSATRTLFPPPSSSQAGLPTLLNAAPVRR
jgi:hypothetical protein